MKIKKSHKGLLHSDLGIPDDGKPIPMTDVLKELHSSDPKKAARGRFALMAKRHFKPLAKSEKKA